METSHKLSKYIPLVDFIGTACGSNFEVILHDVSNPNASVIAVKNGHLSGRKVGDSMTDLALEIMNSREHLKKDFIASYEGHLKSGKTFVSSTYFIKEEQQLLGLLCINYDPSLLKDLNRQVLALMDSFHLLSQTNSSDYSEALDSSIHDISSNIIHHVLSRIPVTPDRMTAREKLEIIGELEKQGVFATKGSVGQTAQVLHLSEPSIYRYLKKVREEQNR
ncbi:hypothetical protein Ami103574_09350 [Aminipila butyrica]|uniref:YheO-like domain-containing protein n=1 Tax=Aminipila butyrica TaxID=433296 RepID=A0A858BVS1_9FIRM|nr:PAS domain-containing protein [Aminipila butyrica]QIB69522.1 hypothetical protein Ami103574_09350 [Aminipila butyrica]